MRILAIDLGKHKCVACDFDGVSNTHTFTTLPTRPQALHDLFAERGPDRVVIEIGNQAGWVRDLCEALDVPVQVANPNHEGWRWKNAKRKTDRDDALKLARLSAVDQLPTVELPANRVRPWRSLIQHRAKLVGRRTAIRNSIRALLDRQGRSMPAGRRGWTGPSMAELKELSRPIEEVSPEQLWRGPLGMELEALDQVDRLIERAEARLDAIAEEDERVRRLRTIPGVGPRLAETVVAVLDDPHRFASRKQVAAYVGLVPRQYESGSSSRTGGITGAGHRLLRSLLVEVAWRTRQHNPHLRRVFEQTAGGIRSRRKIAAVATARRLLVICWAMLRDGTDWRPPTAEAASEA
jgi:transposase